MHMRLIVGEYGIISTLLYCISDYVGLAPINKKPKSTSSKELTFLSLAKNETLPPMVFFLIVGQ